MSWMEGVFGTSSAEALALKADAARDRRDWLRAARLYRASLEREPERPHLWVQLGHALKESGDLRGAERAYGEALEREPDAADTHLQLGHLLKLDGRRAEAAAAYARAVIMEPANPHALPELRTLLLGGAPLAADLHDQVIGHVRPLKRPRAARAPEAGPAVVFDVSDLIGYFRHSRLPTGIQRVQIEVIGALLRQPPKDRAVLVCAFAEHRDGWVEIPGDLFLRTADLALDGGSLTDGDWRAMLEAVALETELGPPLRFPRGAWLVNLGTSWWLQNYFLKVREARRRYGVRYLPFVHDMIPIMAPEHCVEPLVQDFISWAVGVFGHADRFLTNSEASRRDLMAVAERLGHSVGPDQVQVVRLDADFRRGERDAGALGRYGLEPGGYMLFVSTVESRKNHLLVLRALQTLIARQGADRMPRLVCVGARGWLNDAVFKRLESDPCLKRQVTMLSGVPDGALAALYRDCLFTLYPSSYEGWGLPVTESLSWGKAVLASDSSSVPEAGGDLAVYAPTGDERALTEAMERLILDPAFRAEREAAIADRFRPRPWRALADDMLVAIERWTEEGDAMSTEPTRLELGRYYPMSRSRALGVAPGMVSGEVFRVGSGWGPPDDAGSPLRGLDGELEATVDAHGPLRLFLGVRGLGSTTLRFRLETEGGEAGAWEALKPGEDRWLVRTIAAQAAGRLRLRLRLEPQGGGEPRLAVIGWMVCEEGDLAARARFTEALVARDMNALATPN